MATYADVNTLGLWRLDDDVSTATFPTRDDTGVNHLTAGTTLSTGTAGKVDRAYTFNGTSQYRAAVAAVTALQNALRTGVWTFESWVQLSATPPAAEQTLWAVGSTDATAAGNELARPFFSAARVLCVDWMNGTKAAVAPVVDSSASVWAVSTWYRLGLSVDIPGGKISFFRDGVKLSTVSAAWPLPTGGTAALMHLGRRATSATAWLKGLLDHCHLSSVAYSDAAMIARAVSNLQPTARVTLFPWPARIFHSLRGRSPIARAKVTWLSHSPRGDTPALIPRAAVYAGANQARVYFNTAIDTVASAPILPGIFTVSTAGHSPAVSSVAVSSDKLSVLLTLAEALHAGATYSVSLADKALTGVNGAKNPATSLGFSTSESFSVLAVDLLTPTTARIYFNTPAGTAAGLAATYSLTGGRSVAAAQLAGDGLSSLLTLSGSALEDVTYTLSVAAGAIAGLNGHTNPAASLTFTGVANAGPPSLTSVTPEPGTAITADTPISFRVADTKALRRAIIMVRFAGLALKEVIHDGDGFGPQYSGSPNARVSYSGAEGQGWTFTVLRAGGWPEAPELKVVAIDTAGQEV